MNEKGEKGRIAEDIALGFLIDEGLVLLDRNWRWGHRELDLLMYSRKGLGGEPLLHVVEVRSLSEPSTKMPFETVDRKKQLSVIRAAQGYVMMHRINFETRFDVVSVSFKKDGGHELEYFPDAFTPEW
ncbi:hypothetical protein SDC9_122851 [bioreactor metagenome]|uniref:Uncharacterized protein n=1 Tax=bioreactor metagenome TaxID=1076179 RepID=A0A645CFY2_9ZZZZ|nr:YraN family protein [Rikenellaceae bacterium]